MSIDVTSVQVNAIENSTTVPSNYVDGLPVNDKKVVFIKDGVVVDLFLTTNDFSLSITKSDKIIVLDSNHEAQKGWLYENETLISPSTK